jgi:cell division protein FtsI/penicillin-binding protein 2
MLGRTDSRLRMVAILLIFTVVATAAGLRLGYWQVVASDALSAQIEQVKTRNEVASQRVVRADIVDRDGIVLAKTSSFDSLVAYPNIIDPEDHELHVELLSALLDLSARERADYLETLAEGYQDGSMYVSLDSELTLEQSDRVLDAIDDKLLPGIGLKPNEIRHYPRKGGEPDTSLASHIIGFVRADGDGG